VAWSEGRQPLGAPLHLSDEPYRLCPCYGAIEIVEVVIIIIIIFFLFLFFCFFNPRKNEGGKKIKKSRKRFEVEN